MNFLRHIHELLSFSSHLQSLSMQGETTFVSVGSALQHADGSAVAEKTSNFGTKSIQVINVVKLYWWCYIINSFICNKTCHTFTLYKHITLHNIQNHTSSTYPNIHLWTMRSKMQSNDRYLSSHRCVIPELSTTKLTSMSLATCWDMPGFGFWMGMLPCQLFDQPQQVVNDLDE